MNTRLARIATGQGGAFTLGQAVAAGYSRDAVRHRVDSGRWVRHVRGVLAVPAGGGDERERAVRDAWVAVLAHPGAVVAGGRAAQLHGLSTYRPVPGFEMVRPRAPLRTPARAGVVVLAAGLPASHVSRPLGVPSTSLARTAADIARRGSLRDGVVVLDSALQLGCSIAELERVIADCAGWPGISALRAAWQVSDSGAESPLESLAHVAQAEHSIPRPVTQVSFYDRSGFIGRVDDYWPQFATVGESDGLAKYDEPGALRAEKLRQERLEQGGLQVVRVTYSEVTKSGSTAARRYLEAFDRGRCRLAWRHLDLRAVPSPREQGLEAG